MKKGTLFINGDEVGTVVGFELLNSAIKKTITVTEKLECSFHNLKIHSKALKRLFKLPRKKKKKLTGTRSARNKLSKRIKIGLPFELKHINQAGLEIKVYSGKYAI